MTLEQRFGLAGRVALVTGGRQGIGEAIARALAEAGAKVAVTSRDREQIAGVGALALGLDVGDENAIDAAIDATVAELGGLDIVVNNAAVTAHRPALELSAADWDDVMRTNLRGAFLVARAAARVMKDRGGGRIVNLSSPFGRVGIPDRVAYSVSKAGLEQLTRSLAVEWAPYGITVNAVAPTTVLTESRQALLGDEALARRIAQIPLGRVGAHRGRRRRRALPVRRGRRVRDRREHPGRRWLHDRALVTAPVSVGLFGTEPVARMVELAQATESLGFAGAWIGDSQNLWREAYVTLGAAATATSTLRLGTGVTNAVTRHASVLASAWASLTELAPERMVFAIGTGDSSLRTMGMQSQSVAELEERIRQLRRLLAGDEVVAEETGDRYRLEFAPLEPVPIYVAAASPRALRMAGRVADGVIACVGVDRRLVDAALARVREGAEEAGRDPASLRVVLWTAIAVDDDGVAARDRVRAFTASVVIPRLVARLDDDRATTRSPRSASATTTASTCAPAPSIGTWCPTRSSRTSLSAARPRSAATSCGRSARTRSTRSRSCRSWRRAATAASCCGSWQRTSSTNQPTAGGAPDADPSVRRSRKRARRPVRARHDDGPVDVRDRSSQGSATPTASSPSTTAPAPTTGQARIRSTTLPTTSWSCSIHSASSAASSVGCRWVASWRSASRCATRTGSTA